MDIIRLYHEKYLTEKSFKINHSSIDGWTALHYASNNGYLSVIEVLIKDFHADINAVDRLGRSALHWACRFNNEQSTEKLL
jgi:ankyrin repeat protein